jgi:SAM-dependent methyltransferase
MEFFEDAYRDGAPWDLGRAQSAFVRLAEAGEIAGSVLDIGCGTGDNALYLAARGHEVWGLDISSLAIERARDKAHARRLNATFVVGDALNLARLDRTFDSVIDSGFFHTLSDAERPLFALSLAAAINPLGVYHMLCFNEFEPGPGGPRRITQEEVRATFRLGWRVRAIRPAQFETATLPAFAWLATITLDDSLAPSWFAGEEER